jgi:hypothetical protein
MVFPRHISHAVLKTNMSDVCLRQRLRGHTFTSFAAPFGFGGVVPLAHPKFRDTLFCHLIESQIITGLVVVDIIQGAVRLSGPRRWSLSLRLIMGARDVIVACVGNLRHSFLDRYSCSAVASGILLIL